MITFLKGFGEYRERENPRDMFSSESWGFSYVHQSCLTAIIFRQMHGYWLLETAACARIELKPTFDLYRRVAQWATTSNLVSPNVVEDGAGGAAVLLGGKVSIEALASTPDGRKYTTILLDATQSTTRAMGDDLERFGGRYSEEPGTPIGDISDRVHSYWMVQNQEILQRIGIYTS